MEAYGKCLPEHLSAKVHDNMKSHDSFYDPLNPSVMCSVEQEILSMLKGRFLFRSIGHRLSVDGALSIILTRFLSH